MITKYIGLDAHSSSCTFCVVDKTGAEIDKRTIATNGRLVVDYVTSFGPNTSLALEECDISAWLFEILHKRVKNVIVCDPSENGQYKRAKTDKLDAYSLSQLLRGGFLKPVFHDGSEREKFRMLVSAYQDVVSEMTRVKNRWRAIVRRTRETDNAPAEHLVDIELIKEQHRTHYALLTQSKKQYTQRIKESLKRFPESRYLMSIPGIAHINAAEIIAQVINPRRFRTKHKHFSYSGLVRHPRISANKRYGSKRIWGNRRLKCVYKMAARSALRSKSALRALYDSLRARGVSDKCAANAIARKIATLSLTLWRKQQHFNEQIILKSLPR